MKKYIGFLCAIGMLMACGNKNEKPATTAKTDSTAVKTYSLDPEAAIGIGRIEPEAKIIKLYSEVAGTVEKLYLNPGKDVKKGDLLASLNNSVEDNRIGKSRSQIGSQEVQVKSQDAQIKAQETQIQTQQTQVNSFEKDIAKARVALELAQKNFNRIAKVYQQGAETRQVYDNAENQVQAAQAEIDRLIAQQNNSRAQIDNLRAQVEIQKAQKNTLKAKLDELNADLKISQTERNKRDIFAQTNGKVLSVDVTIGSYISPQIAIGDFAPESPINVVCEIDELFAPKVQIGQKAKVRMQGAKETLAEGTVIEVAPYLRQKSLFSDEVGKLEDRRVRQVRVRLDNPPATLLYGARVDCEIKLK